MRSMEEKPKRRWFRFRLRTLLVLVALASVASAAAFVWVPRLRAWEQERIWRQGAYALTKTSSGDRWVASSMYYTDLDWFVIPDDIVDAASVQVPLALRLVGERHGYPEVAYFGPAEKMAEAKRVYPEATFRTDWPLTRDP
jgi:hypothetical protein